MKKGKTARKKTTTKQTEQKIQKHAIFLLLLLSQYGTVNRRFLAAGAVEMLNHKLPVGLGEDRGSLFEDPEWTKKKEREREEIVSYQTPSLWRPQRGVSRWPITEKQQRRGGTM